MKHCFAAGDHRGVNTADAWRSYLPKAIANRKIILTDTRQLPNPEADRSSQERHCIGRHPGVIDEQLSSGTGMYLLQSTFEAIEKETKLNPQLVVLDFCNAVLHACGKGHRAWLVAPEWHEQLEIHALWRIMFPLRQRGPRKGHEYGKKSIPKVFAER